MRRLTRRIGLFGSPTAMMSAAGVVKKPSVNTSNVPDSEKPAEPAEPGEPEAPEAPAKKGWLHRWFGPDDDPS
jgi:hypothetical protein